MTQHDRGYRGSHICELCPKDDANWVSIVHQGKKRLLGSGEITVCAPTRTYATPNLVLHYIAAHGYLPPDDFVDAVMDGPDTELLSDYSLFTGPYWT